MHNFLCQLKMIVSRDWLYEILQDHGCYFYLWWSYTTFNKCTVCLASISLKSATMKLSINRYKKLSGCKQYSENSFLHNLSIDHQETTFAIGLLPELEFIKLNPIAFLLDLRNWYAHSPLKTTDLGPFTKKSNSLNLQPLKSIDVCSVLWPFGVTPQTS
jgi:hypothetical protein